MLFWRSSSDNFTNADLHEYLRSQNPEGNINKLQAILRSSAVDVNSIDDNVGALHKACELCSPLIVHALCERHELDVNMLDQSGWAPLHALAHSFRDVSESDCVQHTKKALSIIKLISPKGLDLWKVTDRGNSSFLHKLVENWKFNLSPDGEALFNIFLNAPRADINLPDASGNTPLILACFNHEARPEVVEFLLRKGANPYLKNRKDQTCIYNAAVQGKINILQVFHQKKINLSATTGILTPRDASFLLNNFAFKWLDKHFRSQTDLEFKTYRFEMELHPSNMREFCGRVQNALVCEKLHQSFYGGENVQSLACIKPHTHTHKDLQRNTLSQTLSNDDCFTKSLSSTELLAALHHQLKYETFIKKKHKENIDGRNSAIKVKIKSITQNLEKLKEDIATLMTNTDPPLGFSLSPSLFHSSQDATEPESEKKSEEIRWRLWVGQPGDNDKDKERQTDKKPEECAAISNTARNELKTLIRSLRSENSPIDEILFPLLDVYPPLNSSSSNSGSLNTSSNFVILPHHTVSEPALPPSLTTSLHLSGNKERDKEKDKKIQSQKAAVVCKAAFFVSFVLFRSYLPFELPLFLKTFKKLCQKQIQSGGRLDCLLIQELFHNHLIVTNWQSYLVDLLAWAAVELNHSERGQRDSTPSSPWTESSMERLSGLKATLERSTSGTLGYTSPSPANITDSDSEEKPQTDLLKEYVRLVLVSLSHTLHLTPFSLRWIIQQILLEATKEYGEKEGSLYTKALLYNTLFLPYLSFTPLLSLFHPSHALYNTQPSHLDELFRYEIEGFWDTYLIQFTDVCCFEEYFKGEDNEGELGSLTANSGLLWKLFANLDEDELADADSISPSLLRSQSSSTGFTTSNSPQPISKKSPLNNARRQHNASTPSLTQSLNLSNNNPKSSFLFSGLNNNPSPTTPSSTSNSPNMSSHSNNNQSQPRKKWLSDKTLSELKTQSARLLVVSVEDSHSPPVSSDFGDISPDLHIKIQNLLYIIKKFLKKDTDYVDTRNFSPSVSSLLLKLASLNSYKDGTTLKVTVCEILEGFRSLPPSLSKDDYFPILDILYKESRERQRKLELKLERKSSVYEYHSQCYSRLQTQYQSLIALQKYKQLATLYSISSSSTTPYHEHLNLIFTEYKRRIQEEFQKTRGHVCQFKRVSSLVETHKWCSECEERSQNITQLYDLCQRSAAKFCSEEFVAHCGGLVARQALYDLQPYLQEKLPLDNWIYFGCLSPPLLSPQHFRIKNTQLHFLYRAQIELMSMTKYKDPFEKIVCVGRLMAAVNGKDPDEKIDRMAYVMYTVNLPDLFSQIVYMTLYGNLTATHSSFLQALEYLMEVLTNKMLL